MVSKALQGYFPSFNVLDCASSSTKKNSDEMF